MKSSKSSGHQLTILLALFWGLFWLFNGLDKFMHSSVIGDFMWFGQDRTEQISVYAERMQFPISWIDPILVFTGVWEFLVAAPFIIFVAYNITNFNSESVNGWLHYCFYNALCLSAVTFLVFCVFDVIAGARSELLEHTVYFVLIAVSFMVKSMESIYAALALRSEDNPSLANVRK